MPKRNGLHPRQLLFIKEYLIDKNATRAAVASGYSAKTARKIGSENLTKPDIAEAIREGLQAQINLAETRAAQRGVTKDRWLQELELIAFANMDDFAHLVEHSPENTKLQVLTTQMRKAGLGNAIKKVSQTETQHGGSVALELHNKLSALELIAKHYGWIKNTVEQVGPGSGPQVILTMPRNGKEAPPNHDGGLGKRKTSSQDY